MLNKKLFLLKSLWSLISQHSSAMPKPIQEQVEELITKEKENASKLQALHILQWDTTVIGEE